MGATICFFCYRESFDFRHAKGRGYRIGHAWSDDLVSWTRDDQSPLLEGKPGEWDSDMQCYPHVFLNAMARSICSIMGTSSGATDLGWLSSNYECSSQLHNRDGQ